MYLIKQFHWSYCCSHKKKDLPVAAQNDGCAKWQIVEVHFASPHQMGQHLDQLALAKFAILQTARLQREGAVMETLLHLGLLTMIFA